ncbi:hypothetical protein B6J23_07780 [Klebsiella pneumoniae]|nr:hypothetical protein B6J23_07780 [Klebsiella pneumoniae]
MKNETLNTLILRHGDRMLRQAGWPDTVDMAPVAPETVPGWLAACGSLSGVVVHKMRNLLQYVVVCDHLSNQEVLVCNRG